jgi:dimethylargininase
MRAFTRAVPPSIHHCEISHVERVPIDLDKAVAQHDAYESALRALGVTVEHLPPLPDFPDSVFVEDTAVAFDEIAIITRPGAASRRGETPSTAQALSSHRRLGFIEEPGTLDGGDVLVIGRCVFVGQTARSNPAGIQQLARWLAPLGYTVCAVPVRGCLHLKTAVTRAGDNLVLINAQFIDAEMFRDFERIEVAPTEPAAGNAL